MTHKPEIESYGIKWFSENNFYHKYHALITGILAVLQEVL